MFLLTATCTVFPSIIPRLRPVALTFIASALVLVMDNINAIFFLLRNDVAMQVFEGYRIKTAQVRGAVRCKPCVRAALPHSGDVLLQHSDYANASS